MATISNAATTSVARVSPETGLLEDPIRPHQIPRRPRRRRSPARSSPAPPPGRRAGSWRSRNRAEPCKGTSRTTPPKMGARAQVAVQAAGGGGLGGGLLRSENARAHALRQVLAHRNRVKQAPTSMPPPAMGLTMDFQMASVDEDQSRFLAAREMGPQEVGQQRHQQAPGQHAAGEVQRSQARPDDVADAQVGRTDRGRRGEGDAPTLTSCE